MLLKLIFAAVVGAIFAVCLFKFIQTLIEAWWWN